MTIIMVCDARDKRPRFGRVAVGAPRGAVASVAGTIGSQR
jgi:hypothetical protein